MSKRDKNCRNLSDQGDFRFLGKGHNGEVYLLPDGKVVKISYNIKNFISECSILEKVNGNKYFPRVYETGLNYMIRDYVKGEPLFLYLNKNGMDRKLAEEIIDMLKEFKKLKFNRIDIRCKDIFVKEDGSIMIIDPKKSYSMDRSFPKHLSKGFYKMGVLDTFLEVLKSYDDKLYKEWNESISEYIRTLNGSKNEILDI